MSTIAATPAGTETDLQRRYDDVRGATLALADPLSAEDCQVQSMPEASPVKWHLAHTSWFFETFLLDAYMDGYQPFRPGFEYLFNSYYYTVGRMHERQQRGLITRPSLAEVVEYRRWVDEHMDRLIASGLDDAATSLVVLGLSHEQQHQELILTDVKHALYLNPLWPAYATGASEPAPASDFTFLEFAGGEVLIGAEAGGFAYDNERPRHPVLLQPFALADRLVTNGEFREFVRDGGYEQVELWLSDGWIAIERNGWTRPLYWSEDLESAFTLRGLRELDPNEPVCHVSHYEADAFARWAGARLPTEFEWEAAADDKRSREMFDVRWQWTGSAYLPYPGFRAEAGSVGEYNGKFMSGQMVLRGGSGATPAGHVRKSYRNFFPPSAQWQFSGIRLAKDA